MSALVAGCILIIYDTKVNVPEGLLFSPQSLAFPSLWWWLNFLNLFFLFCCVFLTWQLIKRPWQHDQSAAGTGVPGRWQVIEQNISQSRQKSYQPAWHNPHMPITHRCCGGSVGTWTKEGPTQSFFSLLCSCGSNATWKTSVSAFK